MAYVSYPEGTLWRSKMDGSERLQLTYPPSQALMPRWSPDGKTIVFFETSGTNKPSKIYEVSREGGSPRQLMPDNPDPQADPNWSPDGSKIVFAGRTADPASSIRILDLATHQVSTLPGSQGMFSPRWSPDGRYIPALSADSKRLLLFDFQTQKWTELATGQHGLAEMVKGRTVPSGSRCQRNGRRHQDSPERPQDGTGRGPQEFCHRGLLRILVCGRPRRFAIMLRNAGTQDVYALDWEEP